MIFWLVKQDVKVTDIRIKRKKNNAGYLLNQESIRPNWRYLSRKYEILDQERNFMA